MRGVWIAVAMLAAAVALGGIYLLEAPGPAAPLAAPPPPEDVVFVIPPGTAAAAMRGEPAFALPKEIRLVPGGSIVIRNEDQAMHYFFDTPVAPGTTYRRTFSQAGRFGYSGGLSCSIDKGGWNGVIVDVDPANAGR